ncbi:hypothetical protein Pyn_41141 [Prunus yedoensis var. nudiflora]|uniref:Uncharacterized protein n=1 Tax=Prunus yedoensis var. nudiflora TaxID=2094558 RepID=A0A314U9E9_PRUYE|nr:hypothetical protein Pyn_41141 [Prunus yedoensis var. nudiflora]
MKNESEREDDSGFCRVDATGGRRKEVSRDLLRAERVLGTALVTPANLPPLVLWDFGFGHYILCVVENILVERDSD